MLHLTGKETEALRGLVNVQNHKVGVQEGSWEQNPFVDGRAALVGIASVEEMEGAPKAWGSIVIGMNIDCPGWEKTGSRTLNSPRKVTWR